MILSTKTIFYGLMILFLSSDSHDRTIHEAVKDNNLTLVDSLVAENPECVDIRDSNEQTALHLCADLGYTEIAEFLISKGAKVDSKDNYGHTPFHKACFTNHRETAGLLLSSGADINEPDMFNTTILARMAQMGNVELTEFLLRNGAGVNIRGSLGISPVFWGVHSGKPEIVKLLIESGADLKDRMNDGASLLHLAVIKGNMPIVEFLIEQGLDVNVTNRFGATPLHLAAVFGLSDMAALLIEKGADVNAKSEHVGTPIHQAMAGRQQDVVDLLLARGAVNEPRSFAELRGKYLGRERPGREPRMFAPEILLPVHWPHSRLGFSRDGGEMFWSAAAFYQDLEKIWTMKLENGTWSPPSVVRFASRNNYYEGGPCLSPDGSRLYFHSSMPLDEGGEARAPDIWFVERVPGGWGEPHNLGAPVNSEGVEVFASMSKSGNLYFQSYNRSGGLGGNDIFVSRYANGSFLEPENLGNKVNSLYNESAPFIDPDEGYVIFHSNRSGGNSPDELFICFKNEDGGWTDPLNMGADINSGRAMAGAVSPDGKYLFFSNDRHGSRVFYWVDAGVIDELKSKVKK